ncbi:beta-galactosidase [Arthrobacter sp. ISL-48]|uniref:beta-galactosidase n=1 Tax=Arthrobacter sp. ISL-48 TaxID=2819110 RepID=UPI001BEAB0FC|nr:beta-galactosidase [Arthrobacter sp. ISL-48]MBT2532766.1 beta-galactosidase [Arthrobacter sp. ISL-48]
MDSPAPAFAPSGILFGAAYYAEYHVADRLDLDLDLMKAAGFNVIRVGESVWSSWEPQDGEFDLEWLAPVLDGAHRRGIKVILGTPTYAVPPWLQTAYPEIAAERSTGVRIPWGARQEVDYSHPAFLFHAERVVRAVLERYAKHPAIIGFQVDNEPGMELFHNHGAFTRFVRRLKKQYGDVETLNREWGLTYWSHRISDWSELWRPDGNTFPQYDLAWRCYQADLTTEFIAWQADLVAEYRRSDQFVTTCLQYPRRGLDDEQVFRRLDIGAGNPYYGMQDHLDALQERPQPNYWTTTGVAGLFRQADRLFSSKQGRYLVTETNAQAIGASDTNQPPYPGQLKQSAFAFISRGAAMIEYWHWHTLPYGAETYWGGVLPHSLVPGRVYAELSELGSELEQIGTLLDGYEPDADVAILWSTPSRFAFQFMPPFNVDGKPDEESYEHIVDSFHRGVIDAGRQSRIIHLSQAVALGAEELVRRFPVLVAAGVYIATDEDLELLRKYAELGGHLVLGVRTGYADEEARARVAVAPDLLHEAAGVRYEEYSNLEQEVPVTGPDDGRFELDDASYARLWLDGLIVQGAEVLASYKHPRFGDFPAVTSRLHGAGRVTVVGCVPSPGLASSIMRWASPQGRASQLVEAVERPLTVSSGVLPDGRRVWFLFNWGWGTHEVTLSHTVTDTLTGTAYEAGTKLSLGQWSTRTFVSR